MPDSLIKGNYKRVIALVSDMHVGSRFALCGPEWLGKEKQNLASARNTGQRAIYNHWLFFLEQCNKWNVDTVMLLGDLVNGYNRFEHGIQQMSTDLDEQKDHAITLLRNLCKNRKVYGVSGSGYHESVDTRVHLDIMQALGGKYFGAISNVALEKTNKTLNISHGVSSAFVYRTMLMSREALFMMEAIQLGKIPKVDVIVRGHWHKFIYIHMEHIHLLQLPGWQAYVPWKGALLSYGKMQPDIGGCILFIDNDNRVLVLKFTMQNIPHIGDPLWHG